MSGWDFEIEVWSRMDCVRTTANPAFDGVLNINEPHLFSLQQLNIETVRIRLRDYSLQSSIFDNESKNNLHSNKHYAISESSSQLKY